MSDDRAACRRKALQLLARRAHFSRQLATKLARRSWSADIVESVIQQLEEEGLLDDRGHADRFVDAKLGGEPMGARRLVWELTKRGVDEHLAREVVDSRFPADVERLVAEAARRWRVRRPRGDDAALARYLERRGFAKGAIVALLTGRR